MLERLSREEKGQQKMRQLDIITDLNGCEFEPPKLQEILKDSEAQRVAVHGCKVSDTTAIEQEEEECLTLFPQSWSQIAVASATIINKRPCHRGRSLSQWLVDTHLSLTQNMAI